VKSRRRRFKQGTFVANNIARTLAEKLGGAEAVDLVEGDVVRFALASVPVGSGGHRVREVGALSRRERGVMKSERRFDRSPRQRASASASALASFARRNSPCRMGMWL
tara:strand:- start:557 stop:880 length:324 start_codon:yes stop_codon:yes gene_type:complete